MSRRDYYEILSISRSAGEDEIKSAYRKLAMKYHPDRNPNDKQAEEYFKEATEAYEVLKDRQKRQTYDQFGHAGLGQATGGFGFGAGAFDLSDALRAFMQDFGGGSIFDDLFGMGDRGRHTRGNRGEDLRVRIELTLDEIAVGVEKSIKVRRLVACDTCGGSGVAAGASRKTCPQCKGQGRVRTVTRTFLGSVQQVTACNVCRGTGEIISDPCRACRGEGRVRGSTKVNVRIPAGVSSGNYMTVEGMGNVAPGSGEPGDLIAVFEETPHKQFTRHGDNIVLETAISFATAAVGDTIVVPTLNGQAKLKIPAGTQSGKVLKLRGMGIEHLHHRGKGDQLVRVMVWVPTKLSVNDKRILEELARSESFEPPAADKSFFEKLRETLGV